jgi:DNA-binding NtrC family response regulator
MSRSSLESASKQLPTLPLESRGFCADESEIVKQLVGHKISEVERELILATLVCYRGNRTCAANVLDISIRALRNKIRAYIARGITVPKPGQVSSHECVPIRSMFQQNLGSTN